MRRRDTFVLGAVIAVLARSIVGDDEDRADVATLALAVFAFLLVIASHAADECGWTSAVASAPSSLESGERGRRLPRRWAFLIGICISSSFLLWRVQRFGLLLQGPSYFLEHAPQLRRTRRFRNLFFSLHRQRQIPAIDSNSVPALSDMSLTKVLLTPPVGFMSADKQVANEADLVSAEDFIDRLDAFFRSQKHLVAPSALYQTSVVTPFVSVPRLVEHLGAAAGRAGRPVVLVMFPGILAEFLGSNGCFDEVFDHGTRSSRFQTDWDALWEHPPGDDDVEWTSVSSDDVWSLDLLGQEKVSMRELVEVGSFDGVDGDPLVRFVRFVPRLGSLESMGALSSSSGVYLRRMGKLARLLRSYMKMPAVSYAFVGYSRGALVALDVAARGNQRSDAHSWASQLDTIVSVGGPLFGAEGADKTRVAGHLHYELVEPIRECARRLDFEFEGDAFSVGHAAEIVRNSVHFIKLGWQLTQANAEALGGSAAANASAIFRAECGGAGVPLPSLRIITTAMWKLLFEKFNLLNPVGQYYENIKRFKILISSLLDGIESLTTRQRVEWWSSTSNVLPTRVALFALPATMPDAFNPKFPESLEKLDHSILFSSASTSTDWWANRMFYYAGFSDHGKECNDGQVSCDRAVFWPELMRRLNPGWDARRDVGVLGIIGSHHWSLALRFALDGTPSPIPRENLLQTIGAVLLERTARQASNRARSSLL